MLRNAWGSKLLALRGVTVGGAGVIFVKISVTYFLNSPWTYLLMVYGHTLNSTLGESDRISLHAL